MDGEVRLVGGTSTSEGTVEICFSNAWGTICDDRWGIVGANVICKQLGFQFAGCASLNFFLRCTGIVCYTVDWEIFIVKIFS